MSFFEILVKTGLHECFYLSHPGPTICCVVDKYEAKEKARTGPSTIQRYKSMAVRTPKLIAAVQRCISNSRSVSIGTSVNESDVCEYTISYTLSIHAICHKDRYSVGIIELRDFFLALFAIQFFQQ